MKKLTGGGVKESGSLCRSESVLCSRVAADAVTRVLPSRNV
jgi:hypothetical protein